MKGNRENIYYENLTSLHYTGGGHVAWQNICKTLYMIPDITPLSWSLLFNKIKTCFQRSIVQLRVKHKIKWHILNFLAAVLKEVNRNKWEKFYYIFINLLYPKYYYFQRVMLKIIIFPFLPIKTSKRLSSTYTTLSSD